MGSAEEESTIAELFYYHGFLPREDVTHLLKKTGDFLVRCTEVEHGSKEIQEYVLSVNVAKGEMNDNGSGNNGSGNNSKYQPLLEPQTAGVSLKGSGESTDKKEQETSGAAGRSRETVRRKLPKKDQDTYVAATLTRGGSRESRRGGSKEDRKGGSKEDRRGGSKESIGPRRGKLKDMNKADGKIRNLVIRRNGAKYMMRPDQMFDGMAQMVDHYRQNDMQLPNGVVNLGAAIGRADWEFTHADIEIGRVLGKGAFGEVCAGKLKMADKKVVDVAIKITKGKCDMSKAKRSEMMKEARLMRDLVHENVVRTYGVAVLQQPIYILLELVNGSSVDVFVKANKGKIEVYEKVNMMLQAAQGLIFLHKSDLIHRDLAARNCLYSKEKVLKISDFGLSRLGKKYKMTKAARLPIKWLAPETADKLIYTKKSDVFSYGIIGFEIFNETDPWPGKTNAEAKAAVMSGERLPLPDSCPAAFAKFFNESVWATDPDQRPNARKIATVLEEILATLPPPPPQKETADPPKDETVDQPATTDTKQTVETPLPDSKEKEKEGADAAANPNKDDGPGDSGKDGQKPDVNVDPELKKDPPTKAVTDIKLVEKIPESGEASGEPENRQPLMTKIKSIIGKLPGAPRQADPSAEAPTNDIKPGSNERIKSKEVVREMKSVEKPKRPPSCRPSAKTGVKKLKDADRSREEKKTAKVTSKYEKVDKKSGKMSKMIKPGSKSGSGKSIEGGFFNGMKRNNGDQKKKGGRSKRI